MHSNPAVYGRSDGRAHRGRRLRTDDEHAQHDGFNRNAGRKQVNGRWLGSAPINLDGYRNCIQRPTGKPFEERLDRNQLRSGLRNVLVGPWRPYIDAAEIAYASISIRQDGLGKFDGPRRIRNGPRRIDRDDPKQDA